MATDERVRVYLPLTPTLLRAARERREIGGSPLRGHAVTPGLLAELGGAGEEDAEYAALTAAALESLTMLGPDEPPRRVVVAADVTGWEPRPDAEDVSAVLVAHPVTWRRLAAVHVDAAEAATTVAAARDALAAAGGSLEDAAEAVEECLDHEPGWFAVQEVDALLEDLWLDEPGGRATIG